MPNDFFVVTPVALPVQSRISHVYEPVHLADAFSVRLPPGASGDPEVLARFVFSQQAPWVGGLMKVRDALVSGLGLKTGKHLASLGAKAGQRRVGIFKIYSTGDTEIVLGEDDKHLDFRVSVLCSSAPAPASGRDLVVSTVVHCHNRLGRVYIFLIAPFHRRVVQSSLRRAARMGWPAATMA
jgi:hypothetical protein